MGDGRAVILIVADAGPAAGLGHLQRCLALAAALRALGSEVTFVVPASAQTVAARVAAAGQSVITSTCAPWSRQAIHEVYRLARQHAASLLIVDADGGRLVHLSDGEPRQVPLCIMDDNGDRSLSADMIVNGNAHAAGLTYAGINRDQCLLGPEFMLLPPPYWQPDALPIHAPATRLLVTLGGGDGFGLWPALIDALANVPAHWRVTVVLGPFVQETGAVRTAVQAFSARGIVKRGVPSLADDISQADLVLTAAGQTLYELAALGRPAVAIPLAANQLPQLAAFERAGTAVSAGVLGDNAIAHQAVRLICELGNNPDRLRRMAAAGPQLIDGQGAIRVSRVLFERFFASRVVPPSADGAPHS